MSIFDEPKIDCHIHLFDPVRFPYQEDIFYRPGGQELGTPAQFAQLQDAYEVHYALAVGPNSGYATDNRCLLDAIARSNGRLKGVAVVANDVTREELLRLKAGGVLGITMNVALLGVAAFSDIADLLDMLAELELFAQIQVENDQLVELMPSLLNCRTRLIFDHCGRPDPARGIEQPGFQALLERGRRGNAFVKLSGYVKYSHQPFPYADMWPYVRALVEAFSLDACLWGSDWPFLRAPERIDYGPLLKLVAHLFPDAQLRRKLMWDTPRTLFKFGEDTL